MGIKDIAKAEMIAANVPVVPGSDGLVTTISDAKQIAKEIGYPVIIKATAGGGGKGIRVARTEKELENGYRMTQQEEKLLLVMAVFTLKNLLRTSVTLKFKLLEINMEMSFISEKEIVRFKDACKVSRRISISYFI